MTKDLYLEDFAPGQTYRAGTVEMTEQDIIAYAKCYDPQAFHTDPEAAANSFFKRLVASGWHTASITMSMMVRALPNISGGMIGMGCKNISWPRPVYPGDRLSVVVEVLEARPSNSNPLRGILRVKIVTKNQDDLPVQEMETAITVPRRAS